VVNQISRFAAHFTYMDNFKPLQEGKAIIHLLDGNEKIVTNGSPEPSSPGIFRLSLNPPKEGVYDVQFILVKENFQDTILLSDIEVYANQEEAKAANPPQPEGDEISYLKEQAWKVEFAIEQVQRKSIHDVIRTSGEIQPVKGEEKIIAAKSSGIVFFRNKNLQEGKEVRSGEGLFSINSKGLVNANLEEKFQKTKARVEQTKADFERAENLVAQQIIGQKEYEKRKADFAIAEAEFQTLTNSYNTGGQSVTASMTGIVKELMVSDGQFVEEGTPLIKITNNRRLLLQAEVSQKYLPVLATIQSANFKTPYQEAVQSLEDYNGKVVSYGKLIEQGQNFVPVLFELDNVRNLIAGSFVDLFLLTKPISDALVIPKSALMQDYSSNYVYVQTGGESFEKREVKLGIDDGVNIQVLSGVEAEEWVVTKGAYQIKMASMSSTIPAHGHSH
jgi:RND family efflux transporter MFP subunit